VSEEKPYAPSAKKLKKATEEGKTPKSKVLNWGISFITLITLLETLVPTQPLVQLERIDYPGTPLEMAFSSLKNGAFILIQIVGLCAIASTATSLLQTRLALAFKAAGFKAEALNPVSGSAKLFSGLKSLPKFLLGIPLLVFLSICSGVYFSLHRSVALFSSNEVIWKASRQLVFYPLWIAGGLLVLFGAAELLLAYRKFYREFGMTLQELKEEYKEEYGDPHVRAERKSTYEQMMLYGLEKRVKNSKVIIVTPRKKGGNS